MREICTSGSVREPAGNRWLYSAVDADRVSASREKNDRFFQEAFRNIRHLRVRRRVALGSHAADEQNESLGS